MDIRRADINNYLISYKGHGMIEHATSSNSIGHVVNHELRHLAEFESRAKTRNLEIVKEDITLRYQFIDGKIVAVGGKATAVARLKNSDHNQTPNINIITNPSPNSTEGQAINNVSINSIDRLLNKIESALSKIKSRLEGYSETDNGGEESESINKIGLEVKKDKLESKLVELRAKKLEITQKEILGSLTELMGDTLNLLSAIYSLKGGNENRANTDKYSKIEVPDNPMQYTGLILDTMI